MDARQHGVWVGRLLTCLIGSFGLAGAVVEAQPPGFGPTSAKAMPAAGSWPTRPPSRIYVLPFAIEPALQHYEAAF